MKDMQEIERALRIVEAKLARVKTAAKERQARIRAKIAGLQGFAASEEATDAQRLEIRKALASLEAGMQNIMPPLEDVEKEVDRIYGDQSLNSTYYFSRRNLKSASSSALDKFHDELEAFLYPPGQGSREPRGDVDSMLSVYYQDLGSADERRLMDDLPAMKKLLEREKRRLNNRRASTKRDPKVAAFLRQSEAREIPWTELTYEQVQEVIDDIYGNQSDNQTYYFNRAAHTLRAIEASMGGRTEMSLVDVMKQMDSLYGDLSKNETYYPSRRHEDTMDMVSIAGEDEEMEDDESKKKDSNWQVDEQHYLLSDDFSDSGHQRMSGYEIPGYFANDNFDSHNTVAPTYRVDNTVDTFGYWGDEVDEMPHVVQNRAPVQAQTREAGSMNPIAKTIYQQMGGRRMGAMIGVQQYINLPNGLGIKWPNKQRSRGNYVEVLLNGKDLYDMTFYNVSRSGKKLVKKYADLYAESLVPVFEDQTGWYLRMSSVKTAALSGADKNVLMAFLDHRPMEGKMLVTDGVKLEKMGMGGRVMAEWVRGKVEATDDPHTRSDEVILRALKKHTPSKLLITSPTL